MRICRHALGQRRLRLLIERLLVEHVLLLDGRGLHHLVLHLSKSAALAHALHIDRVVLEAARRDVRFCDIGFRVGVVALLLDRGKICVVLDLIAHALHRLLLAQSVAEVLAAGSPLTEVALA